MKKVKVAHFTNVNLRTWNFEGSEINTLNKNL